MEEPRSMTRRGPRVGDTSPSRTRTRGRSRLGRQRIRSEACRRTTSRAQVPAAGRGPRHLSDDVASCACAGQYHRAGHQARRRDRPRPQRQRLRRFTDTARPSATSASTRAMGRIVRRRRDLRGARLYDDDDDAHASSASTHVVRCEHDAVGGPSRSTRDRIRLAGSFAAATTDPSSSPPRTRTAVPGATSCCTPGRVPCDACGGPGPSSRGPTTSA